VAEVARRAHLARGHASRVLKELAASGVLLRRDHGRVVTYELAPTDSAPARRLQALFQAEAERYDAVVDALWASVPDALSVVLFGSEARSEARAGSDTDLLLVVTERTDAVEARVSAVCLALAEEHVLALSWHIADADDIRRWLEAGEPFLDSVLQDGITLRGKSLERLMRAWKRGKVG